MPSDTPLTLNFARHDMYRATTLRLHRWSKKVLREWWANHSPQEDLKAQLEIFNSPVPQVRTTVPTPFQLKLIRRAIL